MRRAAEVQAINDPGQSKAQAESCLASLLQRTKGGQAADFLINLAGSKAFINFNLAWIGAWIIVNLSSARYRAFRSVSVPSPHSDPASFT